MKQKTITCPFCNQETIAYEGILFTCTKCNEPIILEVTKSKKVEDNLYFNQDSCKEINNHMVEVGKNYWNKNKPDIATAYMNSLMLNTPKSDISTQIHTCLIKIDVVVGHVAKGDIVPTYLIDEIHDMYKSIKSLIKANGSCHYVGYDENEPKKLEEEYKRFIDIVENKNTNKGVEKSKTIEQQNKETVRKSKEGTNNKSKSNKKSTFITRKECFDDPEPIAFPGFSEIKIIKYAFWILVACTALFLFYGYLAFINPDLLGNREAIESTPLSISLIIGILGIIGLLLTGVWVGYYIVRLVHGVDDSEPLSFTIIRRVGLIGLLISIMTVIWNGALVIMMDVLPPFLLEGITATIDSKEEIQALNYGLIGVGALSVFLYVFHIVNHTRMMCDNNGTSVKLIVSEVGGRLELISFISLVLTGIYYLVNWLFKPMLETICFGYYTQVHNIMWIVLIASLSVFALGFILDLFGVEQKK